MNKVYSIIFIILGLILAISELSLPSILIGIVFIMIAVLFWNTDKIDLTYKRQLKK